MNNCQHGYNSEKNMQSNDKHPCGRIEECCQIVSGSTFKRLVMKYWNGSMLWGSRICHIRRLAWVLCFGMLWATAAYGLDELENIRKTYVKLNHSGSEYFNIQVTGPALPHGRWACEECEKGHIVRNLPKGEYCFSVSPADYESYGNELIASKKVNITEENQVVTIDVPRTSAKFMFRKLKDAIKRLFKGKKKDDFNIVCKIEKYGDDGKLTPYCQWLFLPVEKIIEEAVTKTARFVTPGRYRLTLFVSYPIAGQHDDLDDYIIGSKEINVTKEHLDKHLAITVE